MPRKRSGLPKGLRGGSDARKLIDAIIAAGVPRENIELNGGGHLRVACPDGGIVTVGSVLKTPGAYASTRRDLAAHGIAIPARGGGYGHRRQQPGPRPSPRQAGMVTRYRPGESYAFVTADDGSTWFISVSYLREAAGELAYGTRVTFSGSPVPEPGKRYPLARDVRLAPAGEPAPLNPGLPPNVQRRLAEPASSLPADFIAALEGIRDQL